MVLENKIKKIHGTKAYNLELLKQNGFNIPSFWAISNQRLNEVPIKKLRDIIWGKIKEKGVFILRSSADDEDGLENSFAGIFDSYKIETRKDISEALLKLKNFHNSKKLKSYIKEKKISKEPKMNLILQRYITGDLSGVAFVNEKEIILNARKGTNEDVVNGVESYEFIFDNKNKQVFGEKFFLSGHKTKKLLNYLKKVKSLFGVPQDIEWTIKDDTLFILQSRNITKSINDNLVVWDNSNIIESYPGVVLPLTESFVVDLYKDVYKKVAIESGVNPNKMDLYKNEFDELLGSFDGRFYYNMLNWYKMFTLFPGYARNKKNFDKMITARSKAELELAYHKNVSFLFKIKYYSLVLYKYSKLDKTIEYFENETRKILHDLTDERIGELSYNQCLNDFDKLRKKLVSLWYIPIENDFVAMTFNGLLTEYFRKNKIPEKFLLESLSDIDNLYTTNQIFNLKWLSDEIMSVGVLKELLDSGKYSQFKNEVKKYPKISKSMKDYFRKYGGRFANELKLESLELKPDSTEFYGLLSSYGKISLKKKKHRLKIKLPFLQSYFLSRTKKYLMKREEMRILRAQVFSSARKFFLRIGAILVKQKLISKKEDIFYLKIKELREKRNYKKIIVDRKKEYFNYKKEDLPSVLYTNDKKEIVSFDDEDTPSENDLFGKPCSIGFAEGKVSVIKDSSPDLNKTYEIIVTKTADPGWAPVLSLCKGIIIEKGGLLSHISILARELGVPCIIGIKNATKIIKDGERVSMNGTNGKIKIN